MDEEQEKEIVHLKQQNDDHYDEASSSEHSQGQQQVASRSTELQHITEQQQQLQQDELNGKPKRNPFCSRCRNHGKSAQVKGHKRHCEYRDCQCVGCKLVEWRQLVSAEQIKRRRYQKQDEENGRRIEISPPVLTRETNRDPAALIANTLSGSADIKRNKAGAKHLLGQSLPSNSQQSNLNPYCLPLHLAMPSSVSSNRPNSYHHSAGHLSQQPPASSSSAALSNAIHLFHNYPNSVLPQNHGQQAMGLSLPSVQEQINLVEDLHRTYGALVVFAWLKAEQFDMKKIRESIELARDQYNSLLHLSPKLGRSNISQSSRPIQNNNNNNAADGDNSASGSSTSSSNSNSNSSVSNNLSANFSCTEVDNAVVNDRAQSQSPCVTINRPILEPSSTVAESTTTITTTTSPPTCSISQTTPLASESVKRGRGAETAAKLHQQNPNPPSFTTNAALSLYTLADSASFNTNNAYIADNPTTEDHPMAPEAAHHRNHNLSVALPTTLSSIPPITTSNSLLWPGFKLASTGMSSMIHPHLLPHFMHHPFLASQQANYLHHQSHLQHQIHAAQQLSVRSPPSTTLASSPSNTPSAALFQ